MSNRAPLNGRNTYDEGAGKKADEQHAKPTNWPHNLPLISLLNNIVSGSKYGSVGNSIFFACMLRFVHCVSHQIDFRMSFLYEVCWWGLVGREADAMIAAASFFPPAGMVEDM